VIQENAEATLNGNLTALNQESTDRPPSTDPGPANAPEPASMALLAGGALGLFGARRRQRQQTTA
jgi:hypothetical protein